MRAYMESGFYLAYLVGMLMLPKTICCAAVGLMGARDAKQSGA